MVGFGETLQQARAQKNVTLREAEADTRINKHHLAALEREDLQAMPPAIYARGIVRKYADYLGLDPGKMLDMYKSLVGEPNPVPQPVVSQEPIGRLWTPNFAVITFSIIVAAIVFAWGYSLFLTPPSETSTDPSISQVTNTNQSGDNARPTPPAVPTTTVVAGGDNQNNVAEEPVYRTGIGVIASADVYLQIVVDGKIAYDSELGAGMSTDMFVGTDFSVITSDGSASYFFNSCGTTAEVPMNTTNGEYSVSFSAHSRSCAPPEG